MNNWLWIAFVAIAVTTVFVGVLTVGLSAILYWFDDRRRAARTAVAPGILERLGSTEPEWGEWYADLSRIEQYVARRTVATYLRRVRGNERRQLQKFGRETGLDERARSMLSGRLLITKLRGLVWLTLLEEPLSVRELRTNCTSQAETRAGAARLVQASDLPEASRDGTALICWSGDERLSLFAMDTLYQLNKFDATALLTLASTDGTWWNEGLLVQSLTVLGYCQSSEEIEQFEWLLSLLEHESPQVRTGTLIALGQHGWRQGLRNRVDIERTLTDPEPNVRIAAYELLGRWGDSSSIEWIRFGVLNDRDPRCRLAAARQLVGGNHALPDSSEADEAVQRTVSWARAEITTTRRVATGWS